MACFAPAKKKTQSNKERKANLEFIIADNSTLIRTCGATHLGSFEPYAIRATSAITCLIFTYHSDIMLLYMSDHLRTDCTVSFDIQKIYIDVTSNAI